MKLIWIFLVIAICSRAGDSYSQVTKLNLKLENVTIVDVFKEIERTSEFGFFFKDDQIDYQKRISIDIRNKGIEEILKEILGDTYSYRFLDKNIVISLKPSAITVQQEQKAVKGVVTDGKNSPLPGVTVLVKGTTNGTITQDDGSYALGNISESAILVFSFVGMQTREVAVSGKSVINIVLLEETIGIEEVVAIGYGTIRKGDLTGSVATVSAKDFEKVPATTALQMLQGRASGIQIASSSGLPGAGAQVSIRGVQSINGSNSPIYVVDGMITDNIDNLNPNSIESLTILKDASAAAIYGARAANGVILVTTKRGAGKKDVEISLNAYYGIQTESNLKLKLLNAGQFLELWTEAYENSNIDLPWTQEDLTHYNGVDTDWKSLMMQTGVIQNYDLSVTGGSEKSNYYISAGVLDQKGMVIKTGYKKYTLNFNSDHKISDWIKFGNSLNIYTTRTDGDGTQYANAIRKSPLAKAYEDNGDYGRVYNTSLEHYTQNPVWAAKETVNKAIDKGVQGNLYLTLKLLPGLEFTTRGSMDYSNRYSTNFKPAVSPYYGWEGSTINSVSKGYYETTHWIGDFLLNYSKTFKKDHDVKVLLGYSVEESVYEYLTGSRTGTPTDEIQFLNAGDPTSQLNANGYVDWSFASMFGRFNYNYKQKYLFTATVRRDGTSRLSEANRFGVFPSASVAWRASEENFLQDVDFINDLKIRASYGTLGNILSVDEYGTIASLDARKAVINQAPAKGYTLTSAVNSDLKWESASKKNLGVDIAVLENKLYSTVDFFIEDTYDLLFNEPIAPSTGLSGTPMINAGKVRNTGYDLEIGYRAKKTDWSYDVSFNMSHVKNEVVDLGGRDLRTSGLEEGYPVRSFFGYKSNGIIHDESQLAIYEDGTFESKGIGDIALLDIDGYDAEGKLTGVPDGKVDAADRTIIGKRYPDFIYGALGTVNYKNWGFQVQLQGVQGIDLSSYPDGSYALVQLMSGVARNEDARVLDRYHPEKNPDGTWPKLSKDDSGSNGVMSDFWLDNASYLRVKNVNLSYNLPQKFCSKLRLRQLSLYSNIQNVFTFTRYKGSEADTYYRSNSAEKDTPSGPLGVPQPRTWTFGFKATF